MNIPTLSLAELYAPIRDELTFVEQIFDEEITSDLDFANALCDAIRSYRGKMLRPALLLLSAKATGESCEAHPILAAVVEMVHMATLVHDDVLDQADERRRQPTVAAVAGNTAAVLLGDYLISHAFHLCSSLQSQHASRRIAATANTVCEGELLQNHRRGNVDLAESEYLDIIANKTGALTAVCCELGAKFADADEPTVRNMHAFGLAAGTAFQIVDDVLDVVGDAAEVGKTLGRDLATGALTLPTIHCLAHAAPAVAAELRDTLRGACIPGRAVVCGWLEQVGSIEYAMSTARRFVFEALALLEPLPPSEAKQSLIALTEFILQRRQ